MKNIGIIVFIAFVGLSLTGCADSSPTTTRTSEPVPHGSPQNVGNCTCSSLISCSGGSPSAP